MADEQLEEANFERLLALREGRRNDVYLDNLNKPTVGIDSPWSSITGNSPNW